MNKDIKFIKSEYSIQDLEQFRDEKGFIDLSLAGIKITEESREKRGTAERLKNWIDFNGTKVMLRGNAVENFSAYAELIIEELSKQAGLPAAHYDIVKIRNSDGSYTYGVISEAMLDLDREDLVSLHDLTGDEPERECTTEEELLESIEYAETTNYDFTIEKLVEKLQKIGYSEEDIDRICKDYQKRLVFALKVLDADKHSENISFIVREGGVLEISPVYDSEFSLLLERDEETLQYLASSEYELNCECDIVSPRIGNFVSEEKGGLGSMWKDTLEKLCEDDEIYDFYEHLRESMDIDLAIEQVEKRINAKLPDLVKIIAIGAFEIRDVEMAKLMGDIELDIETEPQAAKTDGSLSFLLGILKKTEQAKIRTAEQVSIRKTDGSRFR